MLAMLAGFAGFERDNTVERALDGTVRLAHEGVRLGGIGLLSLSRPSPIEAFDSVAQRVRYGSGVEIVRHI
jgi:DNA invertase Pin-like site-specific DNA recombinase